MAKQTAIHLTRTDKMDLFLDKQYRRHNPTAKAKIRVRIENRIEDTYTGNMDGNFKLNLKFWNTPVFVAKEK
jgi:hypothetical protein